MPHREDEMIVVRVLGIVKALRQRNHEVIGLVRDLIEGKALEQSGVTLVVGDMILPASYEGVVKMVDVVVHTAHSRTSPGTGARRQRAWGVLSALFLLFFFACRRKRH